VVGPLFFTFSSKSK